MDKPKESIGAGDVAANERKPQQDRASAVPERSSGLTNRGKTADPESVTAAIPDPSGEQMPD